MIPKLILMLKKDVITIDDFFSVQIAAKDGFVQIAGKKLLADGKEIKAEKALNSDMSQTKIHSNLIS